MPEIGGIAIGHLIAAGFLLVYPSLRTAGEMEEGVILPDEPGSSH